MNVEPHVAANVPALFAENSPEQKSFLTFVFHFPQSVAPWAPRQRPLFCTRTNKQESGNGWKWHIGKRSELRLCRGLNEDPLWLLEAIRKRRDDEPRLKAADFQSSAVFIAASSRWIKGCVLQKVLHNFILPIFHKSDKGFQSVDFTSRKKRARKLSSGD